MGVLLEALDKSHLIMKVLLLVALAVAAVMAEPEAEANADAWYGYYGYPYGYHGFPYRYGYYGYPAHYGHYLGKRSADSEPTADADSNVNFQLGPYGYRYVLGQTPVPVGPLVDVKTVAEDAEEKKVVLPVVGHPAYHYYGLPTYPAVPHLATTHFLGKREAEASPAPQSAPEADAWYGHYYGGYYGYPYRYYGGYYGYPYHW